MMWKDALLYFCELSCMTRYATCSATPGWVTYPAPSIHLDGPGLWAEWRTRIESQQRRDLRYGSPRCGRRKVTKTIQGNKDLFPLLH
ncbi:hypothetical protein QR685DRAFT_532537 [Neurospora intermedia]|uniref:Secreted protein n=1 Tax=Neurospora intermedia TaxID=5142 RepID=A0ABR3D5A3_NEUIN